MAAPRAHDKEKDQLPARRARTVTAEAKQRPQ